MNKKQTKSPEFIIEKAEIYYSQVLKKDCIEIRARKEGVLVATVIIWRSLNDTLRRLIRKGFTPEEAGYIVTKARIKI